MCDSTKPTSPTSDIPSKPTAEESEEIAAKWTDDQIQKVADVVIAEKRKKYKEEMKA